MVLASVAPPPATLTASSAVTQTTVQCLVSDLALYPLPANLRLESIDFENLILQHVKNNLYARSDSSAAASNASATITAATASAADPTKDMMIDDAENNLPKMAGMEDTGADTTSTGEHQRKHTGSNSSPRHFLVSLESDRLAWAALKSPLEDGQSAVGKFDYTRHCCHYMSTCLSEIKLCYVNIQLPNIIIWLLSSIPKKIVKRETPATQMSTDGQHQQHNCKSSKSKSALFALVLQCFREVDVVSMRQAYKQLRSMQKQSTQHQQLLTKKELSEVIVKKATTAEVEMQKSNRSSSIEQATTKAGHHILSRQRVPAKLIQEDANFNLKNTSARATAGTNSSAASGIQLSQKKNSSSQQMPQQMRCNHIRSYLSSSTASESEFDTTQISSYLSQKSAQHGLMKSTQQQNGSSSKSARTRSRSVESPRHRLRLLYKPIDDIEVLIPSAYGRTVEQSGVRRTLTKSRPSIGAALKGTKQKSAKDNSYFTDSLNSEGSSLSDESTSGDFATNGNSNSSLEFDQHYFNQLSPKSACGHPIVIKSALKKSSSYLEGTAAQSALMANYRPGGYGGLFFRSSPASAVSSTRERTKSESRKQGAGGKNSRHCGNSNCAAKKNVTFSAYATIQVVDN